MADDRGRRRKKRIIGTIRPRERSTEFDNPQPAKTLMILSKPQAERNQTVPQSEGAQSSTLVKYDELKPPTVLLKAKEEHDSSRAASPGGTSSPTSSQSASLSGRENDVFADLVKAVAQRVYHIQQKSTPVTQTTSESGSYQKLAPFPEMTCPVKLVDESLQWCDNAMEYLQDQTDFYVIGVLGLQGSGKSSVLSLIDDCYGEEKGRLLFKPQDREIKELGEHCTSGIDIYVTSKRIILLDTQPVLSASVMDHMIQYEKKALGGPDYHSTENALQMQSLQLASFMMAVCHTILLVQDWFLDLNFLRFIQSAEMLKPATPTNPHEVGPTPEETTEYYPHIVFVQNKCHLADFSPTSVHQVKRTLAAIFQKSKLKYSASIHMNYILQEENEAESIQNNMNLFLLPENIPSDQDNTSSFPEYHGHPEFPQLARSFAHQVLSMPHSLLTHTALSEKNWFHYAARIWETVKKSTLFLEYNRLLP